MSAYMVSKRHIDALVTAGLTVPHPSRPVRWFWPIITLAEREETEHRGNPFTGRSVELAQARQHVLSFEEASRVGQFLWSENALSVAYRYNESEEEHESLYEFEYWQDPTGPRGISVLGREPYPPNPLNILHAISGYTYQACEHPGWEWSEAHAYIESLTWAMIHRLPGYEGATRDID